MFQTIIILLSIYFGSLFGTGEDKCIEFRAIFIGSKPSIIQKTNFECESGEGTSIPEVTFP